MKALLASLIFSLSILGPVYAECLYNGQPVPAGTKIGGLVCQDDGSWE